MSEENMPSNSVDYGQNDFNKNQSSDILVFIWEVFKVVVISLAIIIPIRYYLVQPFFVKGPSMQPNFHDKDYLIVDEISYLLGEPKRGEVVVFRAPDDKKSFYIKRIIGLPGETVEVKDNKITIYNKDNPTGWVLKEGYLDSFQQTLGFARTRLDESEYWVMGDNRLQSQDSRSFGPVRKSLMSGRAVLRLFPINQIGIIKGATY
jgi:signal peptidase I